ncbi:MAG: hypothetical protein ACREJU_13365 [Nitrospiraceae bacterium]
MATIDTGQMLALLVGGLVILPLQIYFGFKDSLIEEPRPTTRFFLVLKLVLLQWTAYMAIMIILSGVMLVILRLACSICEH